MTEAEPGARADTGSGRLEAAAVLAPVATVALGLIGLGSKSLWYDETYTAWTIRGSWSRLWSLIEDHESPHALYYMLIKAWTELAGQSEWALRFPSVAAAGLAVYVVYRLARDLFGRTVAAAASVALAFNPFVIIWAQQARSYALLLLAASVSTLALAHALSRPSAGRWMLYTAATGAAVFVHLFATLVLPAHAMAVLLRRPRPSLVAPLAALALLGVLAARLAVLAAARPDNLTERIQQPDAAEVLRSVLLVAGAGPLPVILGVLGVLAARRRGVPRWVLALLVTWAVAPFVVTVAVSFVEPVFTARYLIVAVPPFALLTGYWLVAAQRRLAVAVGVALATWSACVLVFWYAAPPLENWRGATADVLAAAGNGEDVLFAPPPAATGFEYYAGLGVAAPAPRTDTVWLLVWGWSPAERRRAADAAAGDRGYSLAERRQVDGWLTVERWVRQ